MLYLSSFKLSENTVRNPNLYPYNVFKGNEGYTFVFSPITVLYGNNGSGKSTLLNIMADKLDLKGKESVTTEYYVKYITECGYDLADDENTGRRIRKLPENSRYIKSLRLKHA